MKLQARIRHAAKQLLDQLLRARARLRKKRERRREFARGFKVAENRAPAEAHRTAIHEAGHAALLVALGIGCSLVSIVPYLSRGWDGFCVPAIGRVTLAGRIGHFPMQPVRRDSPLIVGITPTDNRGVEKFAPNATQLPTEPFRTRS